MRRRNLFPKTRQKSGDLKNKDFLAVELAKCEVKLRKIN
jgi:hypothetical protein